jgi:hypothetical protein
MGATLAKVGVAAGAVGGALFTAKKAFDFTKEGAQLLQLEESFDLMNKQVFKTPGLLDKMTEAAHGTLTDTAAMKGLMTLTAGATQEVASAMAKASPQLVKIAKAANKLNPTLGDTGFLYDSLALGIKRASPMILDNLGLTIKVGDANEKYAKKLGKTTKELSAQEKQLALLEAALESGDQLIQQVGGSVESQADSWIRATTAVGNYYDRLKKGAADVIISTIDQQSQLNLINEAIKRGIDLTARRDAVIASATRSDEEYNQGMTDLAKVAGQLLEVQEKNILVLKEEEQARAESARTTRKQTRAMTAQNKSLSILRRQGLAYLEQLQEGYFEGQRNIEIREAQTIADELAAEALERLRSEMSSFAQSITSGSFSLALMNEDLDNLGRQLITVGGRTADQNRILGEAQSRYKSLDKSIVDYTIGLDSLGLSQDEINEKVGEFREQQEQLIPLIDEMGSITSSVASVVKEFTWDEEALTTALYEQTAELKDNRVDVINLALAFGQLNPAQAEALLKMEMITKEIPTLAQAIHDGIFDIEEGTEALLKLAAGEYESAEAAIALKKEMDLAREALENISKIWEIKVQKSVHTAYTQSGVPSPDAPAMPPPPTGPPPPTDTPQMQHGGSFTVPPGYPGDTFPMRVSSGEHVSVTPRGKGRRGVTINQFFNIPVTPLIADYAGGQAKKAVQDIVMGDGLRG